jgi:threonine dehydratase
VREAREHAAHGLLQGARRVTKLESLDADERRRGVIAMSAGNHAQAVAYHAKRLGIPATIVMPVTTPS